MKRLAFIMAALILALMPASAQHYRDSRYYNKQTGRRQLADGTQRGRCGGFSAYRHCPTLS